MIPLSVFHGGELRTNLPLPLFAALVASPCTVLALMISIPDHRLPTWTKQALSLPFLFVTILIPLLFSGQYKVPDLVATVFCFNVFLRFTELFWIGPVLQARPAYASLDRLHVDLWSAIRKFPKEPEDDKAKENKEYQSDKRFYHIFFYFAYHAIIAEVLGTWLISFSKTELITMQAKQPLSYFMFFVGLMIVLTSMFNAMGYFLQLFYSIYYEKGSYYPEQWRLLMDNPFLATSLDEIWSHRWHQLLRSTWLALPFRPVRILALSALQNRVKKPSPVAFLLASLSVFLISGLMHEYIILCNVGLDTYRRLFAGQQQFFFTIHGVAVVLERLVKQLAARVIPTSYRESLASQIFQRVWVAGFCFLYFSKFYDAFLYWGIQYEHPFQVFRPLSTEILRMPALRPFVGSLL